MPDTLVVGCGNPLASDDGVGLVVARRLAEEGRGPEIEVWEAGLPGLDLIERLAGYRQAVLVDAALMDLPPGEVRVYTPASLLGSSPGERLFSLHGLGLTEALRLGPLLAAGRWPEVIHLVIIQAASLTPYREGLSPRVAAAVPQAVAIIRRLLQENAPSCGI